MNVMFFLGMAALAALAAAQDCELTAEQRLAMKAAFGRCRAERSACKEIMAAAAIDAGISAECQSGRGGGRREGGRGGERREGGRGGRGGRGRDGGCDITDEQKQAVASAAQACRDGGQDSETCAESVKTVARDAGISDECVEKAARFLGGRGGGKGHGLGGHSECQLSEEQKQILSAAAEGCVGGEESACAEVMVAAAAEAGVSEECARHFGRRGGRGGRRGGQRGGRGGRRGGEGDGENAEDGSTARDSRRNGGSRRSGNGGRRGSTRGNNNN